VADRWGPKWFAELRQLIAKLPELDPSLQKEMRRRAGRDPIAFAVLYFGHHLEDPATGEITFSEVHFEWAEIALRWEQPVTQPMEDRNGIIAPRECGKSTWWFLILPLWAAANGYKKFAVAFAHSSGQAEGHLSTLKHELDTNTLLRNDFPDLVAAKRRPGSGVTLADRQGLLHTAGDFVFAAKGADTQVLGMKVGSQRPDLLILDDVEPDESNYSDFQAEKRLSTVTDAIFPLNVRASVIIVGTVTMPESITHQLVKIANGFEPTEKDPEKWVVDENIVPHYYPAIVTDDEGVRRSIWPQKWPLEFLETIEHTRSYAKNYNNDPLAREGVYWTQDDFHYGDFPCTRTALFVDPATTDHARSDFTGIAVVGYSPRPPLPNFNSQTPAGRALARHQIKTAPRGRALVKYAAGVKLLGQPLVQRLTSILADFPEVKTIIVEANQGGDWWKDIFKDVLTADGNPVKVITRWSKIGKGGDKLDKPDKFATALDYWQRGYVLHREKFPMLIGQAVSFNGRSKTHDDVIDAAVQGVLYFLAPVKRVKVTAREVSYLRGVA
jgi:hypothetical protein